jgi:DNA repair protein SbcD/Mre11
MKKPIAIISTDWHLKRDNVEAIKDLVNQQCELAKKEGVNYLICLGDVFDSRKAQELTVLTAFNDIIDNIHHNELKLLVISGNHDKVDYLSYNSFLDSFAHHPAITLFREANQQSIGGVTLHFMPFFDESIWKKKLNEKSLNFTDKNILLTHIAVTGSKNNDGTLQETPVKVSDFKKYDAVLSGHFHNFQIIKPNFVHIQSIQQNNYGEDNQKGFTILYDDCTISFVKSKFKEYKKYTFDIDKSTKKELDEFIKEHSNQEDNIRVEIIGSQAKLNSLKREVFANNGIDLKTKNKEVTEAIEATLTDEVVEFNPEKIKEKFKQFCEEKEHDFNKGIVYLNKKI